MILLKKLILILCICLLTGCSSNSSESCVKSFLKSSQAGNYDTARTYVRDEVMSVLGWNDLSVTLRGRFTKAFDKATNTSFDIYSSEVQEALDGYISEVVTHYIDNYDVKEVESNDTESTYNVDITFLSLNNQTLFDDDFKEEVNAYKQKHPNAKTQKVLEALLPTYFEKAKESLKDNETYTKTYEIHCIKDKDWVIESITVKG